jgi:hypothetical protein
MDAAEIRSSLASVLDAPLVHFGYVDYLRDFQMYFYFPSPDREKFPPSGQKFRFINCVAADIRTSLSPDIWRASVDDRFIGEPEKVEPVDGWVWGTCYADMYPGATLSERSEEADAWTAAMGFPFYEARFEAAPMLIRLVFSDLVVAPATPGETPFVAP